MTIIRTLTAAAALAAVATSFGQITLASWTFETSIPTTGGPLSPEVGSGTATSNTSGTFSNPVGNGSFESWSSNGWNADEYFQFQVATTGNTGISVTFDQTGSNTGPRDFAFQYSTDGSTFTTFANYSLTNDGWSSGTANPISTRTYDLSSIVALNNDDSVFFRLTQVGTTAITGGTVATTGTGRVDNFTVTAIPEPSTVAAILGALVLAGVVVARRRK